MFLIQSNSSVPNSPIIHFKFFNPLLKCTARYASDFHLLRYALICQNCRSHNGMALREEFEHISFFCFKCNFFNPSKNELNLRSMRLAPKALDFQNYTRHENTDDSTENEGDSMRRPSTVSLQSGKMGEAKARVPKIYLLTHLHLPKKQIPMKSDSLSFFDSWRKLDIAM